MDGDTGKGNPAHRQLFIENSIITDKSGKWGGGFYFVNYVAAEIRNCLIVDNKAIADGGGIYATNYVLCETDELYDCG